MKFSSIALSSAFFLLVGCSQNSDAEGETNGGTDGETDGTSSADSGGTSTTSDSSASTTTTGASSDGDTGTTGSGETTAGEGSLDEVEEACEADCEAKFATECAPTNQNVLTCKLSCASATLQLGEFCLEEYTTVVQCRADGGYDCVNGYPVAKSTCAAEQATYTECTTDLGCKRLCKWAVDESCGETSFDACLTACVDEKNALPQYCQYYVNGIHMCEVQSGLECVEDEATTLGDCSYQALSAGECIADETEDLCAGWCWSAEALGCGDGCSTDCQAKLSDETCGTAFDDVIDCGLLHNDAQCQDGTLVGIDICASQQMTYDTCVGGA